MALTSDQIKLRKTEIENNFGKWSAHNIHLGGDVYTIDKQIVGDEKKLRVIVQIILDLVGQPLKNLRILDLGCLEGLYSIELALQGAQVVAIEGRRRNIEKAKFAKEILSLKNLELVLDDVRNLSVEKYGMFDVVLCLGVLYHLESLKVFELLEGVYRVCKRMAIIDTHFSMKDKIFYLYKGRKYWGKECLEFLFEKMTKEKETAVWSSLDNSKSFWLTRPSLNNILKHVGFSSIYDCVCPTDIRRPFDRSVIVAIKGLPLTLFSSPIVNQYPQEDLPERQKKKVHPSQYDLYFSFRLFIRFLYKKFFKVLFRKKAV